MLIMCSQIDVCTFIDMEILVLYTYVCAYTHIHSLSHTYLISTVYPVEHTLSHFIEETGGKIRGNKARVQDPRVEEC